MTLSDILHKNIGHNLYFDLNENQLDNIYKAMQEAIKEDRKNVAEHARFYNSVEDKSFWLYVGGELKGLTKIDKDSIINAPQIELK